jgi:hypothetical protein
LKKIPAVVGPELFHADVQTDRQTDMTKLILAFCCFTKAETTPVSYRSYTWLTRPYLRAVAPYVFDIDFVTF